MVDTKFKKGSVPWNKGKAGIYTEEVIMKNRLAHLGRPSWNKGIAMKEESKRKLSEALRGKSSWMKGRKHTSESLLKMSNAKKGKMVGEKNPFYGKTHSEEVRKKIRESKKGKPSPMKGKKTGKPAWNTGKRGLQVGWNKGKTVSLETIRKMVETRKKRGSYKHTEEQKEKLRKTFANPEVKKKMSESQNKVWTPELRKKRSEALKGKYAGKNNPSYGRKQPEEVKKAHSVYMREYFKTHKHPMIGKKLSKETIEKLRLFNLGRPPWNKGKKMPELSEWGRKNILKQYESGSFPKQTHTLPERKIIEELLKRGYEENIDFIHQYKFMNKFMCDFCFLKQKVIVEVYGDFWHANPIKYPEGTVLHQHQVKGKRIDKSKEAYITKVDGGIWTYLIIWENDTKKSVAECIDKVEEVLRKKSSP